MTTTTPVTRHDGRAPGELRPVRFTRDFTELAAGSVLVELGRTKVLCTASICGAYVALHDATSRLLQRGMIKRIPLLDACAAASVGIVDGACCLDLDYAEDAKAEVDMNVVMTGSGQFIEVQGTAEGLPFGRDDLGSLLDLATAGIDELIAAQQAVLAEPPAPR